MSSKLGSKFVYFRVQFIVPLVVLRAGGGLNVYTCTCICANVPTLPSHPCNAYIYGYSVYACHCVLTSMI